MLATDSSTLEQLDDMERNCSSSYAQSSILSIGVHAYQGNFQMHISASILAFLLGAYQLDFSHQQHIHFTAIRERYIGNFRTTAKSILSSLGISEDMSHLPSEKFKLGWADAIMVYGSLRTIAISPVSLNWQRNAASSICGTIKERLGFQFSP